MVRRPTLLNRRPSADGVEPVAAGRPVGPRLLARGYPLARSGLMAQPTHVSQERLQVDDRYAGRSAPPYPARKTALYPEMLPVLFDGPAHAQRSLYQADFWSSNDRYGCRSIRIRRAGLTASSGTGCSAGRQQGIAGADRSRAE